MIGAQRKILSKQQAKIIAVGAGAIAIAACSILSKKEQDMYMKDVNKLRNKKEACPTCGAMMRINSMKCVHCEAVCQKCDSCGKLYHGYARFCPYCGIESKIEKRITIGGVSYKTGIKEPFPQSYVSHTFCSCGTPFMKNAQYCQLCGKKRPERGMYTMRERGEVEPYEI